MTLTRKNSKEGVGVGRGGGGGWDVGVGVGRGGGGVGRGGGGGGTWGWGGGTWGWGGGGQPDLRCLTSRPGGSLFLSLTTMRYPLPCSIRYRVNGVGDVHTFFLLHAVA